MKTSDIHDKFESLLIRSGEMGTLIVNHNWCDTPLGEVDNWSVSLKNTLTTILYSPLPTLLLWGAEHICFYNDAFRPSLGKSGKHPAIGQTGKFIWEETWAFSEPLIISVIKTGKSLSYKDQLIPIYRNGTIEEVYWTFSYSPVFGDDSEIGGVLVTCVETTGDVQLRHQETESVAQRALDLETAQTSLIEANQYLQNIINLSKEPLQVLEPIIENGKIIDFYYKVTNKAYAAYANTSPEFLQNKKVSEFFPGYFNTSSFINNVDVYTSGKTDTWDIHYNQDGLDLHNRMSATKVGNEVAVYFTDFTEVKHLQQELEKKIIELERSNNYLEAFAHAASHDLKEPVRKIQFFAKSLSDKLADKLEEKEKGIFNRIESAAERMGLLIDDLLMYSQISQVSQETEEVILNEVVQQVVEDLDLLIQQKNAVLKIDKLPFITGYRLQLQQLFQNLVSNALKYSKKDVQSEISITASVTKDNGSDFHLIQIRDNGIGFEQQHADQIFNMFTRLHGKSEYSGNGVGLSIVKKVIENHKGMIRVVSMPGEGSTFSVFLPVTTVAT